MRAAPAVQAVSNGTGPWRWTQCAAHGLAVASALVWAGSRLAAPDWPVALAALLGAALAALLADRCWPPRRRLLLWDGAAWQLDEPGKARRPGQVAPMIDLGSWMLLRFASTSSGPAAVWLSLTLRDAGADWPALRAALYAAHSADGDPAAVRRGPPPA